MAGARAYPAVAADLHKLMTEDSAEFLREVCHTSGGKARFARIGVLEHIPSDQFAATVASARFRDQKEILMALSLRYQQVAGDVELQAEVPWLKDVQRHLERLGEEMPPLARSNFSVLKSEYLDKTMAQVSAWLGLP